MINLLPQKQKKSLFQLLILRETEVAIVGAFVIVCILIVLLAPVYTILRNQTQTVNVGLEYIKNSESVTVDKNMNTVIDDINNKLSIFPKIFSNNYPSQSIIIPLTKHRVEGILITGITYEKKITLVTDASTSKTSIIKPNIEVRGIAKNRLALLAFQKSLESDPGYSSVIVPISDFVKGKDITFSILITSI